MDRPAGPAPTMQNRSLQSMLSWATNALEGLRTVGSASASRNRAALAPPLSIKEKGPLMFGLTRYQWLVLFAAWLGWGFDVFDGLLFNYVAPICVPQLLGLEIGTEAAKQATLLWIGVVTSIRWVGWGLGGILFGMITYLFGRW